MKIALDGLFKKLALVDYLVSYIVVVGALQIMVIKGVLGLRWLLYSCLSFVEALHTIVLKLYMHKIPLRLWGWFLLIMVSSFSQHIENTTTKMICYLVILPLLERL